MTASANLGHGPDGAARSVYPLVAMTTCGARTEPRAVATTHSDPLRPSPAAAPLLGRAAGRPQGRRRVRGLDPAVLARLALDGVPPHQVEHEVGGTPDELGQSRAPLGSVLRLELVRIELESRDHLAAV